MFSAHIKAGGCGAARPTFPVRGHLSSEVSAVEGGAGLKQLCRAADVVVVVLRGFGGRFAGISAAHKGESIPEDSSSLML